MSILCSGSFVADILVPDLPYIGLPGSLVYAPSGIHLSPGGHSSNVAINLVQLGAKNIHAVGSIGKDEIGDLIVEQLKNRGVNTIPEVKIQSTTAKNIALLVKGEDRRFISELTANSLLSSEHLKKAIKKIQPKFFYQGTLGGLPDIEKNLKEILIDIKNSGALVFIDVIMPNNGWNYLNRVLPFVDIFHANRSEVQSLTESKDPKKAVDILIENGVKLVVITDAQNGLIAGTNKLRIDMPAYHVDQIDPTGAGDALSAGIIDYLQIAPTQKEIINNPKILSELLLWAQAAGAACVTGLGATTNVNKEYLKEILNQQRHSILKRTLIERI
jgi:sugar/nucleoside kinase (ribokinase family)